MIDSFFKFLEYGINHILSLQSFDHILFLIVISIPFAFKDWKRLLLLISVFTIGHVITLLLGIYSIISINDNLTEVLIPITILIVALYNVMTSGKKAKTYKIGLLFFAAMIFGLIHGLGFTSDFIGLIGKGDNKLVASLQFALGIELGQTIIVFLVLFLGFFGQTIFRFSNRDWVMVLSAIVVGLVLPMVLKSPLIS